MLATDGAFLPGDRFVALPRVPASLLAESFRRAVLDSNEAFSMTGSELVAKSLAELGLVMWPTPVFLGIGRSGPDLLAIAAINAGARRRARS